MTGLDELELQEVFNTFLPLFCNVKTLHLVPSAEYTPEIFPVTRFPHVKKVKLGYMTSLEVTKSILHSSHHISELSLSIMGPYESHLAIIQRLRKTPLPALRRLSLRYERGSTMMVPRGS
jgi:hypothetical protein